MLRRGIKAKKPLVEVTPKKKKKSSAELHALEQDKTEVFWQSRVAEALEGKHEPTCEPVVSIYLDEAFPDCCVEIGGNLSESLKTELMACLKKNLHTFAWAAKYIPGIDINITCHELNVDPTFKPVKQKRRKLGLERAGVVNGEFEKLLKIGYITKVRYPDWLANAVVVLTSFPLRTILHSPIQSGRLA